MITVTVPRFEGFDEQSERFFTVKETTLQLEHSLISLRTWEQKWHIPFLNDNKEKTKEQLVDYIRCMTINKNVDPLVYYVIPQRIMDEITAYLEDPMTATTFGSDGDIVTKTKKRRIITAEVLYYWMVEFGIPVEFEKWHLNTLLTLIRVISEERKYASGKAKRPKMSAADRAALNAKRREKYHSKG